MKEELCNSWIYNEKEMFEQYAQMVGTCLPGPFLWTNSPKYRSYQ